MIIVWKMGGGAKGTWKKLMIQAKLKSWMYLGTTLLSRAVFSISVGEGVVIKIKRENFKICLSLFFLCLRGSPTG